MAEFADLVLDNATFLLTHGRRASVQLIAFEDPVDGRGRRYRISPLAQGSVNLIAVHAALAAGDDLRLDAFRLAPLPPFRPAALRQQVRLGAATQIAVVVLPEGLGTGAVVLIELPDAAERRRPAGLHSLILCDQEPPFLDVIPFNRPVETVVAHRILPQGGFNQRISEHAQQ